MDPGAGVGLSAATSEILARLQAIPPPQPPPPPQTQDSSQTIPLLEQTGTVVVGPGSEKEAQLLGLGLPKLVYRQQDDLARTKKFAMEQSIKHVLMKQTLAHQHQQQKVAMYAQALSVMAKVHIGSISFDLREDTIKNAFAPFGPIKSIDMSWDQMTGHHKGFAFLEYHVPEAAFLAQEQMNGVLIGGRNIRVVGRSSDMPQAQPIIKSIMDDARACNRIYVASVHPDLNEADLKSVFEAFGNITSCQLARSNVQGSGHRGYGYLEYTNPQSVTDAVASMNLFDLGGQYLRVCKAITPPQAQSFIVPTQASNLPTAAAVAAAAVTAKIQAMEAAGGSPIIQTPTNELVESAGPISLPGAVYSMPPPEGMANGSSPVPYTGSPVPSPTMQICFPPQITLPTGAAAKPKKKKNKRLGAPAQTVPPPQVVEVPALGYTPAGSDVGDSMALVPVEPGTVAIPTDSTGVQPVQQPKKKKPKKKKPKLDKPHDTKVDLAALEVQQSATAAKLMATQTLSDKQRQLIDTDTGTTLAAQEDIKIKGNEARNVLMHKLMRRVESCVMVLRNMVSPENVDEFLQEEVEAECSKFGQVDQVVIYQEKQGEAEDAPVIVKIFVKFSLPSETEAAKSALDGRFFDGLQVKAELYDQFCFDNNDLTS